jgi:hypothetical protein
MSSTVNLKGERMHVSGHQLTEMEIARRSPAWRALSELFLDTELQPDDHQRIAEVIRQAGYNVSEAEAILRNEVAPVFFPNMLSMAGEWVPWSEDFVRELVLKRMQQRWRGGILARAMVRLHRSIVGCSVYGLYVRNGKDWRRVKQLLAQHSSEILTPG